MNAWLKRRISKWLRMAEDRIMIMDCISSMADRIRECERRLDLDNASIENLANRPVSGKPAKKLVRK